MSRMAVSPCAPVAPARVPAGVAVVAYGLLVFVWGVT